MHISRFTLLVFSLRSLDWDVLLGLLLLNCGMHDVPYHLFVASLALWLVETEIKGRKGRPIQIILDLLFLQPPIL